MKKWSFEAALKLNILELFQPSAARKNLKKLNIIDVEAKVRPLYFLSQRKPTDDEVISALESLEASGYLDKAWIDDIEYWSMSKEGEKILGQIHEGEDINL